MEARVWDALRGEMLGRDDAWARGGEDVIEESVGKMNSGSKGVGVDSTDIGVGDSTMTSPGEPEGVGGTRSNRGVTRPKLVGRERRRFVKAAAVTGIEIRRSRRRRCCCSESASRWRVLRSRMRSSIALRMTWIHSSLSPSVSAQTQPDEHRSEHSTDGGRTSEQSKALLTTPDLESEPPPLLRRILDLDDGDFLQLDLAMHPIRRFSSCFHSHARWSRCASTRMDEDVVKEEEGTILVRPSSIQLAQGTCFEKATTGDEEGRVEVREGALEDEDLEDVRMRLDFGFEVRRDYGPIVSSAQHRGGIETATHLDRQVGMQSEVLESRDGPAL